MSLQTVLVSGPNIARDQRLLSELRKGAIVLENSQNRKIPLLLLIRKIDLILIEILRECEQELEMIRQIVEQYDCVQTVLIDGEGDADLISRGFMYGVRDAFRKPYLRELVAERIRILLEPEPEWD